MTPIDRVEPRVTLPRAWVGPAVRHGWSVEAFDHAPAQVARFVQVEFDLLARNPRWIPPFRRELARDLGPGHPFRAFLAQRNFLVTRDGRDVGRLSAFVNCRVEVDGAPLGTIGHFACADDPEAARRLSEAACAWLADQGVRTVWGPMDGTLWKAYRLMTEGFADVPFYGEPWNPEHYPALFDAMGFSPLKRWISTFFPREANLAFLEKTSRRYDRALKQGYTFRPLDPSRFDEELDRLHGLVTDSFLGFLGFHPLSAPEFRARFGGLKALVVPELCRFAHDPDGALAGYVVSLPDFPRAVRAMRGEDGLLAKLRFLANRGTPAAYVTLFRGLTHAAQAQAPGLGAALAYLAARAVADHRVPEGVSAMVAEDSPALAYAKGVDVRRHGYALYQRSL